jgi:hypothetical protein
MTREVVIKQSVGRMQTRRGKCRTAAARDTVVSARGPCYDSPRCSDRPMLPGPLDVCPAHHHHELRDVRMLVAPVW